MELLPGLLDFRGRGIGKLGQRPQRFGGGFQFLGLDPQKRSRHLSHPLVGLAESPDAHQRVPFHEGVIEKRQRQTRDESMNPESEPGQVHGDPIPVHSVNASPRDLPPKELSVFDGKIGALSAQRFPGQPPSTGQAQREPLGVSA